MSNNVIEKEQNPEDQKLFVVRLYDGFDNQWIDVSEPIPKPEADRIWAKHTKNGTEKTSYKDIDYYAIHPADTKMVFSEGFGAND